MDLQFYFILFMKRKMSANIDCETDAMSSVSSSSLDADSYFRAVLHEAEESILRKMSVNKDSENDAMSSLNQFPEDIFNVESQVLAEVKKVHRPLNVGAPIFIPQYNPNIGVLDVLGLIEAKDLDAEEKEALLRDKGYPEWWLKKISVAKKNNLGIQYAKEHVRRRKDRTFNESGKGAKAAPLMMQQSQVKSAGKFWRIYPRPNSPYVEKPSIYVHSKFVAWVYGVAWQLMQGLTHPTQYVTGNFACETLFKSETPSASPHQLEELLVKAKVYVEDYRDFSKARREVRLSEFVPEISKSLNIGGFIVKDLETLGRLELTFKRHKPLYRLCVAYFLGEEQVDVVRLQAALHEKISKVIVYDSKFVHQGRRIFNQTTKKRCRYSGVRVWHPDEIEENHYDDFRAWRAYLTSCFYQLKSSVIYYDDTQPSDFVQLDRIHSVPRYNPHLIDFAGLWRWMMSFILQDLCERVEQRKEFMMNLLWKRRMQYVHEELLSSDMINYRKFSVPHYFAWRFRISKSLLFFNPLPLVVRYQGLFDMNVSHLFSNLPEIPTTISVNHTHSFAGLLGNTAQTSERVIIQVTTLIAQLVTSTSWHHAFLAVTQFVAGNDMASSMVKRIIGSTTMLRYQNGEVGKDASKWWDQPVSTMRKELFDPLWEAVVSCSLVSLISEFFSVIREELCVPIPNLVKELKFAIVKEGAMTLAKSLIAGIIEILNRLKRCVSEKSLLPLWGQKWNPEKWLDIAEKAIIHYPELVIAPNGVPNLDLIKRLSFEQIIPSSWIQPVVLPQYMAWVEDHLDHGSEMISYFKTSSPIVSRLITMRNRLFGHFESCRMITLGGNIRLAPAFVVLYGETGVGKSNLQQVIPKAVARMNNFDDTSTGVYDWMFDANFQNLHHQHWCVRMDDPGHGVAPPTAGVRNEIQEVMALVNNAPYPVEQADVTMKGKVFAHPSLVIVSTNYFSMRVNQLSRYSPAFWRRVTFHVEVCIKEDYRIEGGTGIDPKKVNASGTHDYYILKVRTYDPTVKDPKSAALSDPVEMSLPDFLVLFRRVFVEHQKDQLELVKRATSKGAYCPICCLDSSRDCGHSYPSPDAAVAYKAVADFAKKIEQEDAILLSEKKQGFHHLAFSAAAGVVGFGLLLYGQSRRLPQTDKEWEAWTIAAKAQVRKHQALFAGTVLLSLSAGVGYLALASGAFVLYQGRENNTTEGLVPMNWQRAEQTFTPGIPIEGKVTYTKEELIKCLQESHVVVTGEINETQSYVGSGYLLGHNTVVTCTHFLKLGKNVSLTYQGKTIKFMVTPLNFKVYCSNEELCILRNGEIFGNGSLLSKIWPVIDQQVQQFDEVEIWSDKQLYKGTSNQIKTQGTNKVLVVNAPTKDGDCGAAYIARHNNSWKVVALHFALQEFLTESGIVYKAAGAIIASLDFKRIVASMGTTLQGVVRVHSTLAKKPEDIKMFPLDYKSELWAAMSSHGANPYVLGRMEPQLSGMTQKSKIIRSLMYDDASERFEEKWCGKRGYWNIPDFRGKMKDEKWSSLWTNAFSSQNQAQPNEQLMIAALGDYLYGIHELDASGFAELSEEQVLTGIRGSYVNRVNIKTSVGPPFNRGKRGFVSLDEGNSFMAPEIWEMFDQIQRILDAGDIPSFAGLGVAKDEPIKPDKYPRVFINLPFAANMHLKKLGAWKNFFRTYMAFFECAVGINMTSIECNKLIQLLKTVDDTLTKLADGDARSLDKSWNGTIWDTVALVIYAIAFVTRVKPMHTYQLAQALKHTMYVFKNDLFHACWNPSGNDWTVELNSILMSLCERFIYYLHHPNDIDYEKLNSWFSTFFDDPIPPDCGFTFRKKIALITYGDDNIKACADELPESYCDDWMVHLGIEMTDAQKTGQMRRVPLNEISFLKRNFVWDSEMKCYIPPLSKKSIARMLLMKRDSSLTDIDHCAVVCSEALREAVYHGREFYDEILSFCTEQSVKLQFHENPYFVRKDYDYWREKIRDGSFQTWSNRVAVPHISVWHNDFVGLESDPLTSNFILQGKMSTVPIVNAGNEPANNEETHGSVNVVHDTGVMSFAASAVQSLAGLKQRFFQTMPKNDLTDFPLRATEILTLSLTDSDIPGILTSFDPWELFLSNSAVANKMANYSLIRGRLQLIFVCAIPGNAFGSYVLTALPNGGVADTPTASALVINNVMQTDHFIRIDCASSEDGVLQLDWIWPYDFATLPDGPLGAWRVYFSCLSTLQTAMPGGLISGSIRVFANLLSDYELAVPHFQSKLEMNATIKQMAPKTHARLTQASSALTDIQSLAKKAEGLPIIGGVASAVDTAATAAKSVMSWFGFTRSRDNLAPTRIVNRAFSNLANCDGVDLSETAGLMQTNQISSDPLYVSSDETDCMAFNSLFSRWTLVKSTFWDGSFVTGSTVTTIPVTPFYGAGTTTSIHPTTAGFVGMPFNYWRGDMEYKIVIPVSKLHRGNLQVLWVPVGAAVPSSVTNTTLNAIYDVATSEEKDFVVGFARDQPFLTVNPITDALTLIPVGSTNGRLILRVITPLVSPNPDATAVDVLIFARARSNMEFAMPGRNIVFRNPDGSGLANFSILTNVFLQGASGDGDNNVADSITLVNPSGFYPGDELLFGEKIESVRALLQKPSQLFGNTNDLTDAYETKRLTFFQLGFIPCIAAPDDYQFWTWQGWYRSMFTGLACSERFKIATSLPAWAAAVAADITSLPLVGTELPSTLAPWSNCTDTSKGHEVQIPYYSPRKYVLAYDVTPAGGRRTEVYLQNGPQANNRFVIFYSYGDDIRVVGFRQIPTVNFSDNVIPSLPFLM
jgi:hypothetical protein